MRVDALREIKLLQELHHKNVVPLLDVYKREKAVELQVTSNSAVPFGSRVHSDR